MNLRDWIGRSRKPSPTPSRARPMRPCRRRFDRAPRAPAAGTPLPALWHWLYFPAAAPAIRDRPGRPREARRIPSAGAVAAAHVGRQPVRIPLARYASATRSPACRRSTTSPRRPGAPGRWCSSKCATKFGATRQPTSALTEFHDIVYREAPKARRRGAAAASRAHRRRLGAQMDAGRRAAVPLLGADVQRPPHPLRPPLRHRGRGLSGPDRARPDARNAAARPAAPRAARCRGGALSSSRPCARCSTSILSSSAASRRPTARPCSCGRGSRGLADHGRHRVS